MKRNPTSMPASLASYCSQGITPAAAAVEGGGEEGEKNKKEGKHSQETQPHSAWSSGPGCKKNKKKWREKKLKIMGLR